MTTGERLPLLFPSLFAAIAYGIAPFLSRIRSVFNLDRTLFARLTFPYFRHWVDASPVALDTIAYGGDSNIYSDTIKRPR